MKNINNISILGVGGGATFYVAKYLHQLGFKLVGYDLKKSQNTNDLERMGITILYNNPKKAPKSDLIIYSDAIPNKIIQSLKDGSNTIFIEVGEFVNELFNKFENNELTEEEITAFRKSNIAPLFFWNPDKVKLIGVTGTDGKTTTTSILNHILSSNGYKVGTISTVAASIDGKKIDTGLHTTSPSQQDLYNLLALMQKKGCTHIILETTSQGLYMGRFSGLKFDIAMITNITKDHLSYHKTWNNYANAKSLLFTKYLKEDGLSILNIDDLKGFNFLSKKVKAKIETYSIKNPTADLYVNPKKLELTESVFSYKQNIYNVPLFGQYNISNLLAASLAAKKLGLQIDNIFNDMAGYSPETGRFQIVQKQPFTVIVDFAHTSNAFKELLSSARKTNKTGKIIVVFGCASQRDDSKRIEMGKLAKKHADITILTAEDCRFESLKAINDEIEKGWNSIEHSSKTLIRFDDSTKNIEIRRKAIKKAISLANAGDIVLITGKGHEKSLNFDGIEYDWNEIREVNAIVGCVQTI